MNPSRIRVLAAGVQVVSYTAQCLLISASKRSDGSFSYDPSEAVQLAELLKLAFATLRLPGGLATLSLWRSLPFAVVAAVYAVQNNLTFEALRHLAPADYQLLNNLKLVTTSLTYRFMIKRKLRVLQWLALLLLALGMSLSVEVTAQDSGGRVVESSSVWRGLCVMVALSWCSALAGVYNELLLKKFANLYEANVYLYFYCALACLGPRLWRGFGADLPLRGFDALTWAIVLSNAVLGQAISYVFRYADSVVKLYSACAGVATTAILSFVLFGVALSRGTLLAYLVCLASFCLYHSKPETLLREV